MQHFEPDGETGVVYGLPDSVEEIGNYLTEHRGVPYFGYDTETNGLDTARHSIVGCSISCKEKSGLYIPLRHRIGTNLPVPAVMQLIDNFDQGEKCFPVMHNAKFDVSFSEKDGYLPEYYGDSMCGVTLDDPDRPEKGLKEVAKDVLGFNMTKFEDLFTAEERKAKVYDISTKAPKRCVVYAASDADAHLRVYNHFMPLVRERRDNNLPYKVDTMLVDVIRRIERDGGLELNIPYIVEQLEVLRLRTQVLQEMVWRAVGYEFEIGSSKKLGIALFEKLKLPVQGYTPGGQYSTGEKELNKLAEAYPVVEWVCTYKKLLVSSGRYFGKLLKLNDLGLKPRFSFNMFAAPTYRLAAPGGDPKEDGKSGLNIQAVAKGEARPMMAVRITTRAESGQKDYKGEVTEDEVFFGKTTNAVPDVPFDLVEVRKQPWVWELEDESPICIRDSCEGCKMNCEVAGGIDVTRRMVKEIQVLPTVRPSFQVPKGYLLMGCDYDKQEMVIGANLSKERNWINAFLSPDEEMRDLHSVTARAAFMLTLEQWRALPKEEKERKRDVGKTLNFATFYGATEHTLARNTGLPLAQARVIFEGFTEGLPDLFTWMDKVKLFARREGYITTYFGRRRWLKQFYASGNWKDQGFGDRSAVNTAIQGTAADVTRIAMVRCDKYLRTNQIDKDQARMVLSIHDELAFMVKANLIDTIGPALLKEMQFHVKGWEVQLTVSAKVGEIWGRQKKVKEWPTMKVAA